MEHPRGCMEVDLQEREHGQHDPKIDPPVRVLAFLVFFKGDQFDKEQYDRGGIWSRGDKLTEHE